MKTRAEGSGLRARIAFGATLAVGIAVVAAAQNGQSPSRDTPARQNAAATPTGRMTGHVLAADNGRPVKRARVFITGPELPEGRGSLTDENGVFDFTELPGGRYTLNASKSGFIGLTYGQRRPLQAGTPLQLGDGQQIKDLEFRLPRGGVVAGRVLDESGDPMPGVLVSIMRYQYLQGDRRLVPAGTSSTDDRGQYRVWGLNPGDYYVSAVNRADFGGRGGGGLGGRGGGRGGAARGALAAPAPPDDQDQLAYAPTYYPGVASVNEARPIAVGVSQELLDIDFNLQLIRTARVSGRVVNPDGSATTSGVVTIGPEGVLRGGGAVGTNHGGRIDWDGSFTVANVPPGRYTLRARGNDTEKPQFASQPLTVASGDLTDVAVVLRPGGTLAGTVTFQATQSQVPADLTQVRIAAPPAEPGDPGPNPNARVDKNGRFTLEGVPAGLHFIRPNGGGALRGWVLKSVTIGGRDATDTPLEVRSGETIGNVSITFTDKLTEINGTVTDNNVPVTEFTVLAFSTDSGFWRPQSRQIMTARPDQTGKFRIRGLPEGDYYVVAVDPPEQGEWFEPSYLDQHRAGASRVTLGEGEVKTQDFKVNR